MTSKQKKQLAFLNEMVEYYSADPAGRRGLDEMGNCLYSTPDGKMCAIGRHLPKSFLKKGFRANVTSLLLNYPNVVPKKLLDLDAYFLQQVQYLHDDEDFWNEKGLTFEGRQKVEQIKNFQGLIEIV